MFRKSKKTEEYEYEIISDKKDFLATENLFKKLPKDDEIIKRCNPDSVIDYFPILQDDQVCIKANEYLNQIRQNAREILICVFYRKDFRKIKSHDFYDPLFALRHDIESIIKKTKRLEEIYFFECKFDKLSDKRIMLTGPSFFPINIFFRVCKINSLEFRGDVPSNDRILNCDINILSHDSSSGLTFNSNSVKTILSQDSDIYYTDINFHVFHHYSIENAKFNFENVNIKYNKETLNKIKSENLGGFWNTFNHFSSLKSLKSQKETIDKYINFFKSRDPNLSKIARFIKILLFYFHEGFTNIWKPLILSLCLLFINYFILYFGLDKQEYALSMSFDLLKLYREVILHNFHFTWFTNISLSKVLLFITEPILFFSTLTLLITLKRKFSFKMEK